MSLGRAHSIPAGFLGRNVQRSPSAGVCAVEEGADLGEGADPGDA